MCSCDSSRCQANGGHLCTIIGGEGWKKEWMIQLDHNDDDDNDCKDSGEIDKVTIPTINNVNFPERFRSILMRMRADA